VSGEPVRWRIARWRGQITELGATLGQLGQSGLDRVTAQLLISQARRIENSHGSNEAMSEHRKTPEGGSHCVAVKARLYEARTEEVDNFFGRTLSKYSHYFTHDHESYAVFCFKEKADADKFAQAFDGEPFDPRDKGGGSKWMFWYKGRAAKHKRSPYDFR
jgi:hypothetical protein